MKNIIFLLVLSFLFLFSGCKKEENVEPSATSTLTWEQRFPVYKVLTKDFTRMLGTWKVSPLIPNVITNYNLTFSPDGIASSTSTNGPKVWDAYQIRIQNSESYDRVVFSYSQKRIATGDNAPVLSLSPRYVLSDEANSQVILYDYVTRNPTYLLTRIK